MRLFIAVRPDDSFLAALTGLQDSFRATGVTGQYLERSNLHLTLAFVGQWEEDLTPLLPAVEEPFKLALGKPGIFPEADVLWAGLRPSGELDALAAQVRENLTKANVPFDPRPFYPHITLARKPRLPEGFDLKEVCVPEAAAEVKEVCLYKSERGERGMVYTVIGTGRRPLAAGRGL